MDACLASGSRRRRRARRGTRDAGERGLAAPAARPSASPRARSRRGSRTAGRGRAARPRATRSTPASRSRALSSTSAAVPSPLRARSSSSAARRAVGLRRAGEQLAPRSRPRRRRPPRRACRSRARRAAAPARPTRHVREQVPAPRVADDQRPRPAERVEHRDDVGDRAWRCRTAPRRRRLEPALLEGGDPVAARRSPRPTPFEVVVRQPRAAVQQQHRARRRATLAPHPAGRPAGAEVAHRGAVVARGTSRCGSTTSPSAPSRITRAASSPSSCSGSETDVRSTSRAGRVSSIPATETWPGRRRRRAAARSAGRSPPRR